MKIRFKKTLAIFGVIFLIGIAVLIYSIFVEPYSLSVEETDLKIPRWSEKLNGLKIVVVSDIHGGSHGVSEEKIRRVVENVNEQNADFVFLLGDFVSETGNRPVDGADKTELRMPIETIAENLKNLRSKYGVFAVIGNHDHWYNEPKVRSELNGAGIKMLENETTEFDINGEKLIIWGIEDYWKKFHVPLEPLLLIEDKKNILVITHNPDSVLKIPAAFSILFAGHTHGGQAKFPVFGAHAFVNDPRFTEGFAEVDDKAIFTTTGIGTTGFPIRFRVPPEIAVLKLYAR